jgi:hypothetical protein
MGVRLASSAGRTIQRESYEPSNKMARLTAVIATAGLLLATNGLAASYPPASTDCTDEASKTASWEVKNFAFDSNSKFDYGPGTAGKVSFSIKNSANGYSFDCVQGSGQNTRMTNLFKKGSRVWYSCNTYCKGAQGTADTEGTPPLQTHFSFDLGTKSLSIEQGWTCAKSGQL